MQTESPRLARLRCIWAHLAARFAQRAAASYGSAAVATLRTVEATLQAVAVF